ncbi:MAG TPA: LUD domain-containing protein [Nitrospirota bacterium]|nr:LUD domain-containing protein [Nitrospirota bacterium]
MTKHFKQSINSALQNDNLASALGRFSEAYVTGRAKAYEGIDFEALRNEIARIKGDAAGHFDELAEVFMKQAEARGAKVFRTGNPEKVKEYILDLAKSKGVRSIVKSKSMATEEIHLNSHLVKAGIHVNETDLGEWIIQLSGQRPSHMVMPAIHMTKEQVAEVFSKEVHERLSSDIPRLVKVARNELRSRFLEADMGISGANMAIAETGTIVIITNEGNGRLVTSLPKVHVAVIGLEKLIPSFSDIVPILTALPKSATGQLLTSYVSMITGAVPNTDGSPKELHIILMDNRRTAMAKDPQFKEALQCIRCASCLNVCPVFRIVGGHVFGDVYTGGIGTILTAWFTELKKSEEIQGLCIQCGRCKEVCPAKIDIPELIVELRRRLVREQGQSLSQKAVFSVVNDRRLFHSMLRIASLAQKPFAKDGFIRHLPMFLSDWVDFRSLPAIAEVPFRDRIREIKQPKVSEKATFFAGCVIDFAYPPIGEAVISVLNKAGIRIVFPEEQTCCGAPARYSGAFGVAAQNAIDNIKALLEVSTNYVVSACPTCTVALKHEFLATLKSENKAEWLGRAEDIAAKTVDFSTFVSRLVSEGRLTLKEKAELQMVTYHDSCHFKRTLNVFQEPRELLSKSGFGLIEMFESDMCCGMGGSYALKQPEISAHILERKLKNIKDTSASLVAMDCPGCIMQIKGGFDKEGTLIRTKHTAELLAESLEQFDCPNRGVKDAGTIT